MAFWKHAKRWVAVGLVCLLCGCSGTNVDELLRAPRLSGENGAVKEALDAALGENAQLKYPTYGDFLSPFLSGDWNGDGTADMAVLYRTTASANVCLAVLQKDTEAVWQVTGTVEGLSDMVESVRLASLRKGRANQIVVGYTTQGDEYLAVYAWESGLLQPILQQTYSQYIIQDITGSGADDLVLLSSDAESGKMKVQLLTAGEEGFTAMQAPGLSAEEFSGLAAISAGRGADGKAYLILDGWTGATGASLASMMLYYDGETGGLQPARLPGTQDLYADSLRHVSLLTSRDIDGDGVVEIPVQTELVGQMNLLQDRRMDFIVWRDYTAEQPDKSFGLLDEEYGYYIRLPEEWRGNLTLINGEEEGTVELRSLSGEDLYMTLRVTETSGVTADWHRLGAVASAQIQFRLGEAGSVPVYRLTSQFHVL
ncbi:MAG: hypothetical protein IJ347_01315 [Faecalibacterium sp.]|nr:hypothetical protein [Faecalibacterium sp.]